MWMDKQIVTYPFNGILYSNQNEWTIDVHNNMDESQNNYTEQKRPHKKEHIRLSFIKNSRKYKWIYSDREDQWLPKNWTRRGWEGWGEE